MFKRKQINKTTGAGASLALAVALATGGGMMISSPAHAVNIAQDNLGETLVFPYYTTRNGWATYFNITNTSNTKTVVAKVRWREGVNSRDARDFNVFLSPNDVWTAAVVNTADGAKMVTSDKSCTIPQLSQDGSNTGIDFTNGAYTGAFADGGDTSLDRTREGYFEVISMGVAVAGTTVANSALHVGGSGDNAQTPANCGALHALGLNNAAIAAELSEPENLLKGRAVLIHPETGSAAGYDPLVLANFYNPATVVTGGVVTYPDGAGNVGNNIYDAPSSVSPNLSSGTPAIANFVDDSTGLTVSMMGSDYGTGSSQVASVDAVNKLIMHSSVINDYNVRFDSQTDWVVSFPTKNFFVDPKNGTTDSFSASMPFGPFADGEVFANGESCVNVSMGAWDREEYQPTNQVGFSPFVPGVSDRLCNEVNLVSFGESNVFGSSLSNQFASLPGENGWARLSFANGALPSIGFRMESRTNDKTPGRSYGFANDHAYERPVTVSP